MIALKKITIAMSSHVTSGTLQVLSPPPDGQDGFFLNEEFPSLHGHYYKLVSFSKMMDDQFFQHVASSHKNPSSRNGRFGKKQSIF